ncbi:MAG: class IV adenylate cyclase [Anaerolineales bacterium]
MQEIEVKFCLADLPALESRLQSLGAELTKPRVHEYNLRFDTPEGDLIRSNQVLRLRRDAKTTVTYKAPGVIQDGASSRREINLTVGNFEAAKAVFEALGYQVNFIYEKYRATYRFADVEVVLDETPLGNFVEIEGPNGSAIQSAAARLGLDWAARSIKSYLALFYLVRIALGASFRDMTFANFEEVDLVPYTMGIWFAD